VAKRPHELPAGLTSREHEVLLALAAGKTNKEIAETLGISAKTAGHHVQHIFDKTGVRTRSAATVWAFERDLVQSA
jgi:DNA-binding NarL/FixJ family response regulator